MKNLFFIAISALLASCTAQRASLSDYVNPFIGTAGHGHTYPGATTPFGMVQLSPDTGTEGWDWCSGYHSSDSSIIGFSHTHLSGTGGGDLGDILFMPSAGDVTFDPGTKAAPDKGYRSRFSHRMESASAGYYGVMLDDYGIKVELSATPRTGLHRYIFPAGTKNPHVIIDLRHGIQDNTNSAYINQVDSTTVEGWRRSNGWANDHTVFFRAEFSRPIERMQIDSVGRNVTAAVIFASAPRVDTIAVQVGISTVSMAGAQKNLMAERTEFDKGYSDARGLWNAELSRVKVEGGSETDREIFYTALYHATIAPTLTSDVDGLYRGSDGMVYIDSTITNYGLFSLWDTFRALHPLLAIINEEQNAEFAESMVRYYDQSGRLPVWDLNMCETNCMIGYHAVPVIVSAYLKGTMPADFDAENALQAMVHSAMQRDYAGVQYYRESGYLPSDKENNAVSKALEYSFDDWCIAQMAGSMGEDSLYDVFIERAQYYKNHFDPSDGFMKGRDSKGQFSKDFDPTVVSILGQGDFTEGNAWQYSFFVPQDIGTHIEMLGGDKKYVERLEAMFSDTAGVSGHAVDVTGLIGQYAHGNEPSHHVAYLYSYAGEPWRTQQRVAQIKSEMYSTARDGLSGNEDCGQMSAWYVLSAMGFYEVTPSSGIYVLGTPTFDKVTVGGFTVQARGVSKTNIYIDRVEWDGKPYTKSYITDQMIRSGGTLTMFMSDKPNKEFGYAVEDRPQQKIADGVLSSEDMLSRIVFEPIVDVSERVFGEQISITPRVVNVDATIYYSEDGSEPSITLGENESITIDRTATIRLAARSNKTDARSTTGVYKFYKGLLPPGAKISGDEPDAPYVGGGLLALADGLTGGENYMNSHWVGYRYEGVADQITIELPSEQRISTVGFNAINWPGAWILLPSKATVSFSQTADGDRFGLREFRLKDSSTAGDGAHYFSVSTAGSRAAKFIHLTLQGGNLTAPHPGAGNPAWIFVDEITAY